MAGQVVEYDEADEKLIRDKHKWKPIGRYRVPFQAHFA